MGSVWETIRALLRLLDVIAEVPDDWNNVEKVEDWLAGTNRPLAEVIVLLTPEQTARLRVAAAVVVAKAQGKAPDDIDWDQIIDWLADLLVSIWPEQETMIRFFAQLLKAVIDIILKTLPNLPDGRLKACLTEALT